jgi:hypothetical protein
MNLLNTLDEFGDKNIDNYSIKDYTSTPLVYLKNSSKTIQRHNSSSKNKLKYKISNLNDYETEKDSHSENEASVYDNLSRLNETERLKKLLNVTDLEKSLIITDTYYKSNDLLVKLNPTMRVKNKDLHNIINHNTSLTTSTGLNIADTVKRILTAEIIEMNGRTSVSENNIGRLNQKIDIVNDNLLEVKNRYMSMVSNLTETLNINNELLMIEIENRFKI